ncbi:MAG TPA: iron-sulfur cluster assembly accessory protein [Chitinophagales bacterium]|nr:iron-sulfur cluster assembly accessory protein [Chitinophagales bacterium]
MEDLVLKSGIKKEISLTPGAARELKRLMEAENGGTGKFLRLGVKGGGCAGFTYVLEFDTKKDNDLVYEIDGIKLVVDQLHELYLAGTEIDFQQGLNSRGFVYKNPNASKTCGCGESFG